MSHSTEKRQHMTIRVWLVVTFSVLSLLVAGFSVLTVTQEIRIATHAAILETENVALTMAGFGGVSNLHNLATFQQQLELQSKLDIDITGRTRDIALINSHKRILAEVDVDEVGTIYDADLSGAIDRTLQDGITRTFVEPAEYYRGYPMEMAVIALREQQLNPKSPIIGAILMEYSPIYEELMQLAQPRLYGTVGAGALLIIAIIFLANRVSALISRPLGELESSVRKFAEGNLSVRTTINSNNEIGSLAKAFNKMAEDIQRNNLELIKYQHELEGRVVERTQEIEFMAYHDSLTSLPNRTMFSRLLNQNIEHSRKHGKRFAVLFIDLDRFKNINDSLGHEAGDELLREAGVRIKRCLRSNDIVARLGGDEFVVILPEYDEEMDGRKRAELVAHKLITIFTEPFKLLGQDFRITSSIGISTYPEDGEDEASLTKTADIAMYQAKDSGRNAYQFYSKALYMQSFERLAMESSLRRALEKNELQLYYQAKIDMETGAVTGMEALIRWMHPELGMVSPTKFIPIAEETGLIIPIGRWVLKTACTQNVTWQRDGLAHLPIAVNLSARQFSDDHLLEDITTILHETGLSPNYLEIEITESMIMQDVEKAVRLLSVLKKMGLHVSIDDFGTGYSSLSTLEKFPIDTIKIDRSFIRDVPGNTSNAHITEAIITMGRNLGMRIVAEGVETEAQLRFLRDHACDQLQGFYFNKPMPAEMFSGYLSDHSVDASLVTYKNSKS